MAIRKVVAAMDFGSNAIRGVIAEYTPYGLDIRKKYRFPIRLGHQVFHKKAIPVEQINQVIEAIWTFKKNCTRFDVTEIAAVGTSALREASNQKHFIDTIHRETGVKIQVIDGITEAKLIWKGVQHVVHLQNHFAVLMDVGGGSIEITLNQQHEILRHESLPLGTLRILDQAQKRKVKAKDIFYLVREMGETLFKQAVFHKKTDKLEFVVGTGGNLTTLYELICQFFPLMEKDRPIANREQVFTVLNRLEKYDTEQRQKVFALRKDRADVIIPAIHLLIMLMDITHCHEVLLPKTGLREGVLWDLISPPKHRLIQLYNVL